MSNMMGMPRKCVQGPDLSSTDVQWAAYLAFRDTCSELGWKPARVAKSLRVSLKTVQRWLADDTAVDPFLIDQCELFATLFYARFAVRKADIREQLKRRAA